MDYKTFSGANLNSGDRSVDHGVTLGVASAFGLILIAIALNGNLTSFLDTKGALIVLGGTIGATLISFPIKDLTQVIPTLKTVIFPELISPQVRIERIIEIHREHVFFVS